MAAERRATYDGGSLLAVAVAEFNTRGYDAASMEDLARAAGITKSSIYHHFRSKEELLRAALERSLGGLFAILDEPGAVEGPAVGRLRYVVGRQVEVLQSELPYVTLLLRVRGNTDTERWALGRRRAWDAAIASLVKEAVAEGSVAEEVDPALAARLLSGMVNSISEWYTPRRRGSATLAQQVVEAATVGILPLTARGRGTVERAGTTERSVG